MITRPLDLASRLRPPPRSFDTLFYVNVGLLGVFFMLFGSPFVLAPALGVDFRLPMAEGANTSARAPTHVISVLATGQIFTAQGVRKLDEMNAWFVEQAKTEKTPVLLVRADATVPTSVVAHLTSGAKHAGFDVLLAAGETPDGGRSGGR
jgi:biopolymer transport protein ExbD